MKAIPLEQMNDIPSRWLRFLPRWSLVAALVILMLPLVIFGGVGQQPSDNALGTEYAELLQAARSPAMYRLGMTFDALGWLMIGGSLLTWAAVLSRRAPIGAVFIAACGIGQIAGVLGGLMRLNGVSELAKLFAAASPDQQIIVLRSYLDLWAVINSHFHAGNFIQGVGFLLVAWTAFSLTGFPRWLAIWLALPGLLPLVQFVLVAAGAPFSLPLVIFHVMVGVVALNFALAVALWRPAPALVSSVARAFA
jgi:hypothetical protein